MTSPATGIEVRELVDTADLGEMVDLLQRIWGTDAPIVNLELARAIGHTGGYVAAAYHPGGAMVGASVGFLALHEGRPALHSHVTGLLPEARATGVGRAIKVHQRAWAAERRLGSITWTFDPLVRRNAWFNIAVLGADVHSYLPAFYGTMNDAINAGDESDRLYVAWDVAAALPAEPQVGDGVVPARLVATPDDIVALRRSDPAAVAAWRASTRDALMGALADGCRVVGFTRDGNYVIGSPT